jgi:hypothetical protein
MLLSFAVEIKVCLCCFSHGAVQSLVPTNLLGFIIPWCHKQLTPQQTDQNQLDFTEIKASQLVQQHSTNKATQQWPMFVKQNVNVY